MDSSPMIIGNGFGCAWLVCIPKLDLTCPSRRSTSLPQATMQLAMLSALALALASVRSASALAPNSKVPASVCDESNVAACSFGVFTQVMPAPQTLPLLVAHRRPPPPTARARTCLHPPAPRSVPVVVVGPRDPAGG